MHLLSPSSSSKSPQLPLFSHSPSPNHPKFFSKIPIRSVSSSPLLKLLPNSSKSSAPSLQPSLLISEDSDDEELQEKSKEEFGEQNKGEFYGKTVSGKLLVVRRPVLEIASEETDDSVKETTKDGEIKREEDQNPSSTTSSSSSSSTSSSIELGLSKIAKKMPMFEPERVNAADMEKPLGINLELALYRAKVLARKFQFDEAEKILRKCISIWPEDGRPYVALGKILSKQSKMTEARSVYETGCQATQGENAYIWQCWAVLENKNGNVRRARELFDAATVADKKHIAAWHGWAILEIKQGNVKKARNLLGKGLKYCGGNEYVYQTLALLEAKANRIEQARYLFRQATLCNPKSCASWLAWAQIEMRQENHRAATKLFEKAVQASPKNRFAWHVWGIFEASKGDIEKGRKLLKIGHALNPRDPVLLQSLALLEYQHSSANLARVLFRRASELDPRHQPVWIAWGWMEWKEGNIITARELYQRALSIDSTSESAARCLQAWGVLEQRIGNLSAARRLFRSSLNINSQSYVTWMTWASLEEEQGNSVRAEEIRNLYFQQRTEVVDDASWVMGFLDIIDPALDSIMRLLNLDSNSGFKGQDDALRNNNGAEEFDENNKENNDTNANASDFDLDGFLKDKLSLDPSKLDAKMEMFEAEKKTKSTRQIWKSGVKTVTLPSS